MKQKAQEGRSIRRLVSRRNFDCKAGMKETQIPFAKIEAQFRRKLDGRKTWCVFRSGGKDELNYWDTYANHWIPVSANDKMSGRAQQNINNTETK